MEGENMEGARNRKNLHADLIVWLASAMRSKDSNGVVTMTHPIGTYVELGLHKGRTFNQVAPLVTRAVGVDRHLSVKLQRYDNAELYEMTTAEFATVWTEPIDLLFIDACHQYESVKFDFNTFAPFVRPHLGLIVLHDTYTCRRKYSPTHTGLRFCWKVADEIHRDPQYAEYEIVTLPVQNCGLSIVRKAPTHLDWMPKVNSHASNT